MFIVIFRENEYLISIIMHKIFVILLSLFFSISCYAQIKLAPLPVELKESSALIKYQESFLSVNDSDNEPIIFVFNQKGEITHKCFIKNAINYDWEAIAYDGKEYLYIGDIGNNTNTRKNLTIYKVKMNAVLKKDTINNPSKILFSYPEQKVFPPDTTQLYYDAEAFIVKNDSLFIFTKNRTRPYDGISKIYSLPINSGQYKAHLKGEIHLTPTNWLENSITDASLFEDKLYLLTYSKVIVLIQKDGEWKKQKEYPHQSISQKEGIAVDGKYIYMTDEYKKLFGGNFLYQLRIEN